MKKIVPIILLVFLIFISYLGYLSLNQKQIMTFLRPNPSPTATPVPSPTPTPSPTPSPSPLTFAQMNELYGPCVYAPTLMYHHVQNMEQATAENHAGLTVDTKTFRSQMQYLKDRGYTPITAQAVAAFFDTGSGVPSKSVVLTFDDGYKDFTTDALPILKEFSYPAILFVPTGLVENPGYVNWNDIRDAAISQITIGNHTWSHQNVGAAKETVDKEISTADNQLSERSLIPLKVFSYPYGLESYYAIELLTQKGYSLAFTTQPGGALCKQKRFELPRIRIGNTSLGAYGF